MYIVIDLGVFPSFAEYDEDPEQYRCHVESTEPWCVRETLEIPSGLAVAHVAKEPFDETTKLAGWKFVGWVDGGMGGGRLLEGDAWFHDTILFRGQDGVNEIRRLLGLPKLQSLDLVMAPEAREHNELMCAVGF